MTAVDAANRVGQWIRGTHPYTFRSGQWGRILALTISDGRWCYMVGWDDEVSDLWVVDDPDEPYEFDATPRHWAPNRQSI